MKNEKIIYLIIGFFICSTVFSGSHIVVQGGIEINESSSMQELLLDQKQENSSYEMSIHHSVSLAQSFTPSISPLTKIEFNLHKPRKTDTGIEISIRKSLNGPDLSNNVLSSDQIPFFYHWIEVDIYDIDVTIGEEYYIIISSNTPSEQPYRWMYEYKQDRDMYPNGRLYRYFTSSHIWEKVESDNDFVDATFRTYSYTPHTEMICEGYLNWSGVVPNQDNLTGSFTIRNNGTPYSKLDWKIISWPSWGTWTFSQMNGTNLRPEDGMKRVNILVEAPQSNVPDLYTGNIIIKNVNDETDICTISAQMVTAKTKNPHNPFFRPYMQFPIINFILYLMQTNTNFDYFSYIPIDVANGIH